MIFNNILELLKYGISILILSLFLALSTSTVYATSLSYNDAFQTEQDWMNNPPKEDMSLQLEGTYTQNSRIVLFGDSCTHGYPDKRVDDTFIYSYAQILSQLTGQEYHNCAWYGSSMAGMTEHTFFSQLRAVGNLWEYDIAIVQFGINDYCMHIPLGDYNSADYNTICGALNNNIKVIRDNGVEPIVILPYFYHGQFEPDEVNWQNLHFQDYVDTIRKWCEINDVSVIDFNSKFNITLANFDDNYMDYIHPNQDLQKRAAQVVYDYIMSYGDGNTEVENFVNRMYRVCLQRNADAAGKEYWEKKLLTNQISGINLAYNFVFCPEMNQRNLSDDEFIDALYRTLMGREADSAGKAYWEAYIKNGMSKTAMFAEFANSAEYRMICESYGISLGDTYFINKTMEPRDKNYGVTSFIGRLYTQALGRDYDSDGLNYWCGVYYRKELSMLQIATSEFFHSTEFLNKKLNDERYLTVLYHTFLDREPEAEGLQYWKNYMKAGATRDQVLQQFAASQEFREIMSEYGL